MGCGASGGRYVGQSTAANAAQKAHAIPETPAVANAGGTCDRTAKVSTEGGDSTPSAPRNQEETPHVLKESVFAPAPSSEREEHPPTEKAQIHLAVPIPPAEKQEFHSASTPDLLEGSPMPFVRGISPANLVVERHNSIDEAYDLEIRPSLGKGAFGSVWLARDKVSGGHFAVKTLRKDQAELVRLKEEIEVMKALDHPSICKIYESYQDLQTLYLVMEVCQGGELLKHIQENQCQYTELQIATAITQIFSAVRHLHIWGVVHRDLKPENVLLKTQEPLEHNTLKIIDFGLSKHIEDHQQLKGVTGSAPYVAPEVIAQDYGKPSDLWSCGVILYLLFTGKQPFTGMNDRQVLEKVKKANYPTKGILWDRIPEAAQDLIQKLLVLDPVARLTAEEALNSDWIQHHQEPRRAASKDRKPLPSDAARNMQEFCRASHLKKAALLAVAHRLQEDEVEHLRKLFAALDVDSKGALSYDELSSFMPELSHADWKKHLQSSIDINDDGCISHTEFLAATMDQNLHDREDLCLRAFKILDLGGTGSIKQHDLEKVFNDPSPRRAREVFWEVDSNHDGGISFGEFLTAMKA